MNTQQLFQQIQKKQSFLCVGLDTDLGKIPEYLLDNDDPIYAFNKSIIDATAPYCVAYKPNVAFYEAVGQKGWIAFEKTVAYIKQRYPDQFIIADAKRCDIGNTAEMYARFYFDAMKVDAVTVSPYMGEDSVKPFLLYPQNHVILLALTSNKGAHDFQLMEDSYGERLFEKVLRISQTWASDKQMMYVVGATQGRLFEDVRKIVPHHFCLFRHRSPRRVVGRSVQIWHEQPVRITSQFIARHSICRLHRRFCQCCMRRSKKLQQQMSIMLAKYLDK